EERVITWALDRGREIRQERGEPVRLGVGLRDDDARGITLLERYGFKRANSCTHRMLRSLDEPIPVPLVPGGFILRHLAGEEEVEAFMAMYRDVFDQTRNAVAWRLAVMRDPAYIRELDLLAVAPGGIMAAFCTCSVDWEENERLGRRE